MKLLIPVLLALTAVACGSPIAPSNDQIPCAIGYHRALDNTGNPTGPCVPR